jgi:hypothetical protein
LSGDHQVVKRQHVSFSRFLAFDLTHEPRRAISRGMNRNQVDYLFDTFTAALAGLRCLRAVDPMHEFGHAHRGQAEIHRSVPE